MITFNQKLYSKVFLAALVSYVASCAKEATFADGRSLKHAATSDPESVDQVPEASEVVKEFTINSKDHDSLSIDLESQIYQKEIKMALETTDKAKEFTQNDRAPVTKMFEQGTSGTTYTETFDQSTVSGIVDILIVVDNSGSMDAEQANLASKLDPLLSYITNTDWQIGVVTTDASSACMRAVIKKGESDIATRFNTAIQAGITGSGNERGIYQAMKGLKCSTPSWIRANSTVAVLIISDEDNCSTGCAANSGELPADLLKYISDPAPAGLGRAIGTQARIYGLIWHPNDVCSTGQNKSTQYAQAISLSSGAYGSICAADYTSTLQTISANIASILKSQFMTIYEADAGSLKVEVKLSGSNDYSVVTNYTVAATTITFSEAPPVGSTVRVSYVVGKKGEVKTQFALDEKPADGTLQVLVNGATVDPSTYTVGSAPEYYLTFAAAPADGSTIKAMFRSDTALVKDFEVEPSLDPNYIVVKINTVETKDYTYSASTGFVTFAAAPIDAAIVRVEYKTFAPILSYTIGVVSQIVKVYDKATSDPVNYTLQGEEVLFDVSDFVKDRVIVVDYKLDNSDLHSFSFPHDPILDSVVISETGDCSVGNGIVIEPDQITVNCSLDALTKFVLEYDYAVEWSSTFKVGGVSEPEKGTWAVYLNGQKIKSFSRDGSSVTINAELADGDVIKIIYSLLSLVD
jgi:hypothetical protein